MDFAFSDDQLAFREAARKLLRAECTPSVVRAVWEGAPGAPGVWQALCDNGIVGLCAPEAAGGIGLGMAELAPILHEAGYVALPEPLADVAAAAVPLLGAMGAPGEPWLARVVTGESRVAVALDPSGRAWGGADADVLLIEEDEGVLLVEADGAIREPRRSVDRGRRLTTAYLEESREPLARAGIAAFAEAFDRGALGAAAELCGVAERLLDEAVEYAKVRTQFGKPIGTFQAVKHHLADARLALEFARPAVWRAAWSIDQRDPFAPHEVSAAKALASDAARQISEIALQVHGAIGYSFEHDLHLWMKRAWALAAAWGDAAFHRRRVAAWLLDVDLPVPLTSPPGASHG